MNTPITGEPRQVAVSILRIDPKNPRLPDDLEIDANDQEAPHAPCGH